MIMARRTIPLGAPERLSVLYSYPNRAGEADSLAATIEHWCKQSIDRDGLASAGVTAVVESRDGEYRLQVEGPDEVASDLVVYGERLPGLLAHGWEAWSQVVPDLKRTPSTDFPGKTKWDPLEDGWRFFLPLGLALARQRTVQFFHYPPRRLLDPFRDYLDDPVPTRCEEMLVANGVASRQEARRFETVMDAAPIAASDDQGTLGTIPIDSFHDYQRAQTRLLLNRSDGDPTSTIPIVVYGQQPNRVFAQLFLDGEALDRNQATTAEGMLDGARTPVISAVHPYAFYAIAQLLEGGSEGARGYIGQGFIWPQNLAGAQRRMQHDLVVARWQLLMAEDPTRDPAAVVADSDAYWRDAAQQDTISSLVLHQGSLHYPDGEGTDRFEYRLSLAEADRKLAEHDGDLKACVQYLAEGGGGSGT